MAVWNCLSLKPHHQQRAEGAVTESHAEAAKGVSTACPLCMQLCVCVCTYEWVVLLAFHVYARESTVDQMHCCESLQPQNREALANSEAIGAALRSAVILLAFASVSNLPTLPSCLPSVLSMTQPSSTPVYVGKYSRNGELFLSANQGLCSLSLTESRQLLFHDTELVCCSSYSWYHCCILL